MIEIDAVAFWSLMILLLISMVAVIVLGNMAARHRLETLEWEERYLKLVISLLRKGDE